MNVMPKMALKRLLVEFFEGSHPILAEPAVTLLRDHALAAAELAQCASAPQSLVIATLLRDIAPLISTGRSPRAIGANQNWPVSPVPLSGDFHALFGQDVLEPLRLQPEAERYLVTVDAHCRGALPAATIRAMSFCDLPMSGEEILAFEDQRYFRDALKVYRWHALATVDGTTDPMPLLALFDCIP